jgi:ADP-ribose pyrophosphatase YjhB (NUDIX family)
MCTPSLAIDLILVSSDKEFLWLVRRQDTNQLATMGGFVNVDETVEHAVTRELKEEMDIDLMKEGSHNSPVVTLFGVYSDPRRDNRRRTASAVFVVTLDEDVHRPKAGDDAKEVKRISINDIEKHSYFADHRTILLDYRRFVRGQSPKQSTLGDFAPDIARSTCAQYQ